MPNIYLIKNIKIGAKIRKSLIFRYTTLLYKPSTMSMKYKAWKTLNTKHVAWLLSTICVIAQFLFPYKSRLLEDIWNSKRCLKQALTFTHKGKKERKTLIYRYYIKQGGKLIWKKARKSEGKFLYPPYDYICSLRKPNDRCLYLSFYLSFPAICMMMTPNAMHNNQPNVCMYSYLFSYWKQRVSKTCYKNIEEFPFRIKLQKSITIKINKFQNWLRNSIE